MTEEEFDTKKAELTVKYKEALKKLDIEYAFSNNPVKIGDIITDHYHTIKVESFKATYSWLDKYPTCTYKGVQYTKKGEVSKIQKDTGMCQCNIKIINGVKIKD